METQGPGLAKILEEALAQDLQYQAMTNAHQKGLYRRRLRYRLADKAWSMSVANARDNLTTDAYNTRREELATQAETYSKNSIKYIKSSAARNDLEGAQLDALTPILVGSGDEY